MSARVLKFVQINIYKGRYFEALVEFLRTENPDIISLQEVSSGEINLYPDKKVHLFEYLKKRLGLNGEFVNDQKFSNSPGKMGNAILTKLPIVGANVVTLNDQVPITIKQFRSWRIWPKISRHLLDVTVDFCGQSICAMSWHGAWTAPPTDTDETLRQAKIVADYLKSITDPFILGVDLNNIPTSATTAIINQVANNLMINSGIVQTTHPKIHKIVPRGYLVDYIFTSRDFRLIKLDVPQVTVSDHLPVIAQLEFV